ncbi:hypothetical protein JXL21_04250 [Candidatus Bathyarchaeota archaeon]|nr:hypothetical protein [Candidatus Bathyarchaeota archaeon]
MIPKNSKVCPNCGEKRPFLKKLKLKPLEQLTTVQYASQVIGIAALRLIVSVVLLFIPVLRDYISQTDLFINLVIYGAATYGLYYKRRWAFLLFGVWSILVIILNFVGGNTNLPWIDLIMIYYSYKGYTEFDIDELLTEA